MDALTKVFLEWANRKGYDTAHAYNQNESRWMFLSPMTADVYEAWQAARTVPDGYVMVPVEPTKAMIDAGRWHEYRDEGDCAVSYVEDAAVASVWSYMLSAAPGGGLK